MQTMLAISAIVLTCLALTNVVVLVIFARRTTNWQKELVRQVDQLQLDESRSALDSVLSLTIMGCSKGEEGQIPTRARRLALPAAVRVVDEKHPGGTSAFLAERTAIKLL